MEKAVHQHSYAMKYVGNGRYVITDYGVPYSLGDNIYSLPFENVEWLIRFYEKTDKENMAFYHTVHAQKWLF